MRLSDVTIYDREGGVLHRVIHAAERCPDPRRRDWQLQDVRIYDADMNVVRRSSRDDGDAGRHRRPADPRQGRPDASSIIGR